MVYAFYKIRVWRISNLTMAFLFISTILRGQDSEIERLIHNELKMTFPSIYFKHNSTDYALMPYKVDSCFKHIALNYDKDMNSLVIWRDRSENEALTHKRIKKLNSELRKYIKTGGIEIYSMGQEQKISRRTISMTSDKDKIDHLLTLNSVFDISKTRILSKKIEKKHKRKSMPRLVWTGWRTGFHWSTVNGLSPAKKSGK